MQCKNYRSNGASSLKQKYADACDAMHKNVYDATELGIGVAIWEMAQHSET